MLELSWPWSSAGFGLQAQGAVDAGKKDVNCIMLMLVGGPSQLDTWDMKPNAPAEIRGPYKPIKTNVPGIEISENFPRMAKHADKYALIRSVYHTAAAVHDTGHQMMQTGRLFQGGIEYPHIGCVLGKLKGPKGDVPPHVLLPRPIGNTGGNMPHGQNAGFLGKGLRSVRPERRSFRSEFQSSRHAAAGLSDRAARGSPARTGARWSTSTVSKFETSQDARLLDSTFHQAYTLMSSQKAREAFELHKEPQDVREKYGMNRFGQSCLLARRLIEAGVRFVTVNMFETVFDEITWDIHGSKPFSPDQLLSRPGGPHVRHGVQFAARRTAASAACSTTPWWWQSANSAARRRSIRPAAATTGRNAGPS